MVRYFYAPTLAHRVVVEVDIGAFVEAMMRRVMGRRGDVVVDICEAMYIRVSIAWIRQKLLLLTASRGILRPALEASCWCRMMVYQTGQISDRPRCGEAVVVKQ
jgi:hypothetical protein